jgi:hypothetical protein
MFSLSFDPKQIRRFASSYPEADDHQVEKVFAPEVRVRGYYTQAEFVEVCHWKSPRTEPRVKSNPAEFVKAVTQTALNTSNERLRIEVLTLLNGVSWPTASVLLHFGFDNQYPILDFRALWSLGLDEPPDYNFGFWWEYTQFCRKLAAEASVSMRTLDRALWQYSKDNQGKNENPHA